MRETTGHGGWSASKEAGIDKYLSLCREVESVCVRACESGLSVNQCVCARVGEIRLQRTRRFVRPACSASLFSFSFV